MMTSSCSHLRNARLVKHLLQNVLDWEWPNSSDLLLLQAGIPTRPDVRQRDQFMQLIGSPKNLQGMQIFPTANRRNTTYGCGEKYNSNLILIINRNHLPENDVHNHH